MKLFYTFILFIQIICLIGSLKEQKCICAETPPNKCECKECNCANED